MQLQQKNKVERYEISTRENLTIDEVVKERAELLEVRGRGDWVDNVIEAFDVRLRFLDGKIVEYFLEQKAEDTLRECATAFAEIAIEGKSKVPTAGIMIKISETL